MRVYLSAAFVFSAAVLASSAPRAHAAAIIISLSQLPRVASSGVTGSVDLTAGGVALDWLKPVNADLSFAEKDAANLLNFSQVGVAALALYADDGYNFTYSGGDPGSASGSLFTGSRVSPAALGIGFRLTLTIPVAGDFTINWYSAANNPEKWTMTATAGTATDTETPTTRVPGGNGVDELFWTVSGTADTAGQEITLDLVSNVGTALGSLAITGANVTSVPEAGSASLLLCALAGIGSLRRRRMAN